MATLKLELIRRDDSAQPRAMLNTDHAKDLSDALEDGGDLTPVDVFHDGFSYWLADGFHRYSAYHRAKRDEIPVNVHKGNLRDAVLYSITVNAKHTTLKLTREEKRASVTRLVKDAEWGQWSNREIGRRAGVSEFMVRQVRDSICDKSQMTGEPSGEIPQIERKVKRGDSEYTMQVAQPKVEAPKTDYTAPRLPDPVEEDELDEPEARAELVRVEITDAASKPLPEETPYTRTQAHMESDGFKRAEFLRKHIVPLATLPEGQLSEDLQLPDSVALRLPNFMKTIIREVAA